MTGPRDRAPSGGPAAAEPDVPRSGDDSDPWVDAWLVSHAVRGDAQAYETLVRRHQALVYRVAYRMLGNASDAEDVTQDVWLQVWASLSSFAGSAAFTAWLYRIAVNKAIGVARRRYRSVEQLDGEQPATAAGGRQPAAPSSEDAALAGERSRAVDAAVAQLGPDLRAAFVLRHFEDLSYQDIARVLGVPEATVRGRLVRSRRQLMTALGQWR